ncbi:HAD family hydrolase [Rufibacter latericius]|uniref:phosphoglycolate phosphatase n=1 Tax=Rufibacter latericius TaxID=2487040 RepID=A0A3M9MZL8_9BACT|nr:HAD family hydrolase [Rufibacter latericius]RNI31001.1 HAD family hydrolase [Rufibacter latericius]
MVPYSVVIFDFDGTLCATEDAILYTFKEAFEQKGITPPAPERIKQAIGTGGNLSQLLPLLHPSLERTPQNGELEEWVHHYRHIYDTDGGRLTTLFPGVEELLPHLKDKGTACVVISNKGQRAIEDALKRFHLDHYFDLVIGDNPQLPLKKKPDPMAYEQVIKPHYPEVTNDQVLMVGDTDADLVFANNAGISSCWAAYGYGAEAACLAAVPTHTIQSFEQLRPIVLPEA